MAVDARIQIPVECQERAGQAGHCDAQVQDGDICQRLFLARTRGCRLFVLPKTNTAFWQAKIDRNRERDRRNEEMLRANGWQVITLWACNLTKNRLESTMQQVVVALNHNLLMIMGHHVCRS